MLKAFSDSVFNSSTRIFSLACTEEEAWERDLSESVADFVNRVGHEAERDELKV